MKHLRLFEDFKETNLDPNQVWYTGRNIELREFTLDHLARENNDEHGPGIYLTNMQDDAKKYGKFIHVVKLEPTGEIIKRGDKMLQSDKAKAIKIIKGYASDWEMEAQNYNENPSRGLVDFTNTTSAIDRIDFYEYVWSGFFLSEPKAFAEGMAANGIDGIIVPGYAGTDGMAHLVAYNMDALKLQEVIKL